MRKIQNNIFSIDPLITIIFLILVFIGFISIFSTQIQDDVVFFSFNNEAFKQLIWIIFSFVILLSVFFLEHRFIYNLAAPLYIFAIVLLPENGAGAPTPVGTPNPFNLSAMFCFMFYFLNNPDANVLVSSIPTSPPSIPVAALFVLLTDLRFSASLSSCFF